MKLISKFTQTKNYFINSLVLLLTSFTAFLIIVSIAELTKQILK